LARIVLFLRKVPWIELDARGSFKEGKNVGLYLCVTEIFADLMFL
jgi:hypothetical protein